MTGSAAGGHRREARWDLVLITILIVVAWLLYQPTEWRSFDYVDFPENLKVLIDHPGLWNGYSALMDVYRNHGRWSPITIWSIAAQWAAFENWTPGWQLIRFAIMSLSVILAYSLFRRLGIARTGAFAAGACLIIAPAAIMGWTRLSTAEPNSLLFLLLACHVALGRQTPANSVILSLLLLAVMWSKEITTAAFVLPFIIAICVDNSRLAIPKWTTESRRTIIALGCAFALGAIPILRTLLSAPRDSFAGQYANSFSVAEMVGAIFTTWLPFAPVSNRSADPLIVAVAFLLLIVAGWRIALGASRERTHQRFLLAIAIALPVIGAIMYAPWPYYLLVYALPFWAGGSLLLANAAAMAWGEQNGRVLAAACLTIVLTFGASQAYNESSRTRALHSVFARAVAEVPARFQVDTVLVDVAPGQFDPAGNFGPRFVRYSRFLDVTWPAVRDVSCREFDVDQPRMLRLRLNLMCDPPDGVEPAIEETYSYLTWPDPRPKTDTVSISFQTSATR